MAYICADTSHPLAFAVGTATDLQQRWADVKKVVEWLATGGRSVQPALEPHAAKRQPLLEVLMIKCSMQDSRPGL